MIKEILFIIIILFLLIFIIRTIRFREFYTNKIDLEEEVTKFNPVEIYGEKSKYNKIQVLDFDKNDLGFDRCLFLNDELQLCQGKEHMYHETIVHYAASYIKNINNVLIIGGGDCMTLREIMKYNSLKHVTMLELDEKVIDVSKKYFKVNDYQDDPRVNIIIGDANKNIDNVSDNFYDLIIIDTTEDSTNNSPIDKNSFILKCKKKLKINDSILVKNGDNLDNYIRMNNLFKYTDIIKYDINIWGGFDYKFLLGSNSINLNKNPKYKHNILIKYYSFKDHKKFLYNIL